MGDWRKRILVVDDLPEHRLIIIRLLERFQFEFAEAGDGQEAVDLWRLWQPDLILMDLYMPVMNGYEATRQIRAAEQLETSSIALLNQERPATKIIALTASWDSNSTLTSAVGFNDFLSKPFRFAELSYKVKQQLDLTDEFIQNH